MLSSLLNQTEESQVEGPTLTDTLSKGLRNKLAESQDLEHIRKYWNESNLRTVVHEMLQPLIKN